MVTDTLNFVRWLQDSHVPEASLTVDQRSVLQAADHFLQQRGRDYFSRRLLSHVLLHAGTGLKVAQIARLLGFSRSAASAQQGLSSKEVVQATHHRLAGRVHGKLWPRFAGPVAQFLHEHPEATRRELLDFIQRTWGVSVSRMALHRFLKKYGLDPASRLVALPTPIPTLTAAAADPEPSVAPRPAPTPPPVAATPVLVTAADPEPSVAPRPAPTPPPVAATPVLTVVSAPPAPGMPVPVPPPAFFLPPPSTPVPS